MQLEAAAVHHPSLVEDTPQSGSLCHGPEHQLSFLRVARGSLKASLCKEIDHRLSRPGDSIT